MNRYIMTLLCVSAFTLSANAGSNSQTPFFKKGLYLSLDFSAGAAFNERISERGRNSSYGTDVAVGYRFAPALAVALGTGAHAYSNRTLTCNGTVLRDVENTCVPIFIRLRSDLLSREVSPYVQTDLGYSFMDLYSRDDMAAVSYADHPFPNGRYEYVDMDDNHIQYGNAGFFASMDIGVGLWIIGPLRMNIALSGGVHQAFLGTSFQSDGEVMDFGRIDYLPSHDGEPPVSVWTVGRPGFKDTLEPYARVKISFSF